MNGVLNRSINELTPLISGRVAMRTIKRILRDLADTDATILLRGESGAGKDVVARAIHGMSARQHGPFVKVNCAAPPLTLLESRLFGYETGAFLGASRRRLGLVEYANKGTIYLDQISDIPLALRAKLLSFLKNFTFTRIGGQEAIEIDARVIASTNRDVDTVLTGDDSRADPFSWLNAVELRVPPLRERRDEIPLLIARFLARFNEQYRRHKEISPGLLAKLAQHSWPGNVRELEEVVRRIVVLGDGAVVAALDALRPGRSGDPVNSLTSRSH